MHSMWSFAHQNLLLVYSVTRLFIGTDLKPIVSVNGPITIIDIVSEDVFHHPMFP